MNNLENTFFNYDFHGTLALGFIVENALCNEKVKKLEICDDDFKYEGEFAIDETLISKGRAFDEVVLILGLPFRNRGY